MLERGTIVDAMIISAPSSTKNQDGERDPEMHQTKKGEQWYFGMKAHIGVDVDSGYVHTVTTTAANEADVEQVADLLHGKETVAHADAGYIGAEERVERKGLTWKIALKRGTVKAMAEGATKRRVEKAEKRKASIRARVDPPFRSSCNFADSDHDLIN
jgi:IS5 family transposase